MKLLNEILHFNEKFIINRDYEKFQTSKFPDKKLVILSCMDTRLVELLPQAMNIKNGDVKIIKNAGASVLPFDSTMRSILIAIYELKAVEVCVVGHHECGMSTINTTKFKFEMLERGIEENTLRILENSGVNIEEWIKGFSCVKANVNHSVNIIKNHPLLPKDVVVHGLIIDPNNGKLDIIRNGYEDKDIIL
jgi:carbonic anhydrase